MKVTIPMIRYVGLDSEAAIVPWRINSDEAPFIRHVFFAKSRAGRGVVSSER